MPRFVRFGFLVFIAVACVGGTAFGHRLSVFVYPEGDEIRLESYFNRGAPCRECAVHVTGEEGELLVEGKTDEEGLWAFVPPASEGLTVEVVAGEGHRTEYKLQSEDYPAVEDQPSQPAAQPPAQTTESPEEVDVEETEIVLVPAPALALNATEVERIVDQVVERQLSPIRRRLAEAKITEPGIKEILGGLGYILGIFGTAMFFMSRKSGTPND